VTAVGLVERCTEQRNRSAGEGRSGVAARKGLLEWCSASQRSGVQWRVAAAAATARAKGKSRHTRRRTGGERQRAVAFEWPSVCLLRASEEDGCAVCRVAMAALVVGAPVGERALSSASARRSLRVAGSDTRRQSGNGSSGRS
jgi:hypothetical protein